MTAAGVEHRALCPSCGRLAIREVINHMQTSSTVMEATFSCEHDHLFIMRWLRPAEGAQPDATHPHDQAGVLDGRGDH